MKQILCFGDSNTYGLIPGTKGRYDWGIRWSSILAECLGKRGYHVIEEGLCGRTTVFDDPYRKGRRGSELLTVLLEAHSPIDIVVLMLGTNDCKTAYGATSEKIGEGVALLIDQIRQFNPEIQLVLVSPIALGDKVWEEGYDTEFDSTSVAVSRELPKVYERIAREKGIQFLPASAYAKPSIADREHMDALGHKRFAKAITEKLESMIASAAVPNAG